MSEIIGLDFGNYKSFPCIIRDIDPDTRIGSEIIDLLPPKQEYGIPSVYFYAKEVGVLCGEPAERPRAKPVSNRLRFLKRHLGETITLDDRTISYDEAITAVIQHCVREANKILQTNYLLSTDKISLSYPAAYNKAQMLHLVSLAEKATLADGRSVKVSGTIAEPAAAALDYFSATGADKKDCTVLVYDLGGGTFDLALVSVYPKGRLNRAGKTYYYDILATRGIGNLGGAEFDAVMYDILEKKFKEEYDVTFTPALRETLSRYAEKAKIDLTDDTETEVGLGYGEDILTVDVTLTEFENGAKSLLKKTVDAAQELLAGHPDQKPDMIILTGGSSRMPMVQNAMEEALPAYRGKVQCYRPERAIAYGAARYGTAAETDVQQRVMHDLGIRFYHNTSDKVGYIDTEIPAGTVIPVNGDYCNAYTLYENQRKLWFRVYEAKADNPVSAEPDRDYTEIMSVTLDFGKSVPVHTGSEVRLDIDKSGIITVEARDPAKPDKPPVKSSVELKNLS